MLISHRASCNIDNGQTSERRHLLSRRSSSWPHPSLFHCATHVGGNVFASVRTHCVNSCRCTDTRARARARTLVRAHSWTRTRARFSLACTSSEALRRPSLPLRLPLRPNVVADHLSCCSHRSSEAQVRWPCRPFKGLPSDPDVAAVFVKIPDRADRAVPRLPKCLKL